MASTKERASISKSRIVEEALEIAIEDLKAKGRKSQLASKTVHQ
jgi:hypothetical protein